MIIIIIHIILIHVLQKLFFEIKLHINIIIFIIFIVLVIFAKVGISVFIIFRICSLSKKYCNS